MKQYEFDSTEQNRMGQYLIEALREENLINESLFHAAMLKESMASNMTLLTEMSAHAVETQNSYTFQGVTVTRDAFRAVYSNYDKYPDAESILYGLGFPTAYRSAEESTLNKRVKKLVRWYNNNTKLEAGSGSNAAEFLPTSLHERKRQYSFKAREENARKAKGYATTRGGAVVNAGPSVENSINGGRNGRRTALTRTVDQVNSSEVIDGTFYNDRTKIPPRVWSNWVRFWDSRSSSVRPNRRSLLGEFFGLTWKKTFILGYTVNNNTAYEIWYNSYDSTFSIYDRNGVDVTRPIATVQEAIKSLIHVISQSGKGDIETVAAGGTSNDTIRSMMRGLSTGLDKDMDVIKRQDELNRHEAMRLKKEKDDAEKEAQQEKEGGKYSVNHTVKAAARALDRAKSSTSKAASAVADDRKEQKKAEDLMRDYAALEKEQSKLSEKKLKLNQKLREVEVGSDAYQGIRDKMFEIRQRITQVNIEMQATKNKFPEGYSYADFQRKEKNARDWKETSTTKEDPRDAAFNDAFGKFADEQDPMVDKAAERRIKALRKANTANSASPEYRASVSTDSQSALAQQIAQTTQNMRMVANEREIARRNGGVGSASSYVTGEGNFSQITTGLYQKVYNTNKVPSYSSIDWDDYAMKLDTELKSMNSDYKKTIRQNNAEALAKEFGTTETVPEMKRNAANGKYGLGDRFNVLKKANEAFDPFTSGEIGNDEIRPHKGNTDVSEVPQIDDSKVDPKVKQARDFAQKSSYTQQMLKSDVAGVLSTYDKTKVPETTLTRSFISAIQGNLGFLRGREASVESPRFGLWNRFKMSLRNQYYRSDFVIGFSLSNAINIEVWYVTEPDPNNPKTTLSSFYVYDVEANKMIRKYAPYYRTALLVVVAKLGVKL